MSGDMNKPEKPPSPFGIEKRSLSCFSIRSSVLITAFQILLFMFFDNSAQRLIIDIRGTKMQLPRHDKLRFEPRPYKLLTGHTMVFDKPGTRKRSRTEDAHPTQRTDTEMNAQHKVNNDRMKSH
jgi:hypothetical protein